MKDPHARGILHARSSAEEDPMWDPPDTHEEPPKHPLNWHAFISLGSTDTCRQQWTCMPFRVFNSTSSWDLWQSR